VSRRNKWGGTIPVELAKKLRIFWSKHKKGMPWGMPSRFSGSGRHNQPSHLPGLHVFDPDVWLVRSAAERAIPTIDECAAHASSLGASAVECMVGNEQHVVHSTPTFARDIHPERG